MNTETNGLLEYLSRPDRLALLTPDSLVCICQKQSKRALNIPTSTMGGKIFWDSLEVDGWKIQRNRVSGHCRVLDPENQRRAHGSENELKFYFECYLSEEQQRRGSNPNKYGIVLSGGGGKGAFEVGVWRYLHECRYDRLLNGVSGASVGALNSLLLVNGDLEKAEKLWATVTQKDMLPLNLDLISKFFMFVPFGTLPLVANFAASQVVSLLKPKKDIPLKSGGTGIMSQWGLAQLIDQSIDWTRIQHSGMTAFCSLSDFALFSKSDYSGDSLDVFRIKKQPEYACWSNMEPQITKELVLASAALPLIYGSKKVHGHNFHDGGIQDNVPIRPLVSMGYSEIIVVHLRERGREADKEWKHSIRGLDLSGVNIYHVYPDDDFQDNFAAMLTVDSNMCKVRMEQGYRAAKNQLDKLPW